MITLDQVKTGERFRVVGFSETNPALVARLREIGFAEEDEVELLYTGPLARRPLCFRLNRTMIALRLDEAIAIEVESWT
ncbi:MAG: ferrous iron transport protein A [Alphaproteobacteria bacterium]|nr:MAG: ferrous iron transport protein A [Alphaproteobacteria bacterium]